MNWVRWVQCILVAIWKTGVVKIQEKRMDRMATRKYRKRHLAHHVATLSIFKM